MYRQLIISILCFFFLAQVSAQTADTSLHKKAIVHPAKRIQPVKRDSLGRIINVQKLATTVKKPVAKPQLDSLGKPIKKQWVKKTSKPLLSSDSTKNILNDTTRKWVIKKPLTPAQLHRRDSLRLVKIDSLRKDSIAKLVVIKVEPKPAATPITWKNDTLFARLFKIPYLPVQQRAVFMISSERIPDSNDELFYALLLIVALLAFIKAAFPKYFQNAFRLFFQTSFRQKQTRENLLQDYLPSLLLNLMFVITGGLFITLVASTHQWFRISFWEIFLYCAAILALVYGGKFIVIQFTGWVFNAKEAAGMYVFIVFMINKIIGVLLIPLLLLLAFANITVAGIVITIAGCVVTLLLGYRYIISLSVIGKNLQINPLHFFIYLCAVEIMPMLIIYKVLFNEIGSKF